MSSVRRFQVGNHVEWTVFEVIPEASLLVSPHFSNGWLSFEGGGELRRLVPIPPDWESASESELRSMLARAKPARHTPP
jgi:hypothetical protein